MFVLISLQILSKTVLILRRIQRDIIINIQRSSCKLAVITRYSGQIVIMLEFSRHTFKKILKYKISWKSVHWEPEFLQADGKDEANNYLSEFCKSVKFLFPQNISRFFGHSALEDET